MTNDYCEDCKKRCSFYNRGGIKITKCDSKVVKNNGGLK